MTSLALIATSLGLSTDAFAAALARGGARRTASLWCAAKVGAVFGASEGTMCLIGWALASQFSDLVTMLDHWIALVILSVIGLRMIHAGAAAHQYHAPRRPSGRLGTVLTALGTGVDAAAVGVAIAFMAVDIRIAAAVIGLTSFTMSTVGYLIGPFVGERLGGRAEVIGGLVLIAIGISIFMDHMTAV